jgi:transposase
MANQPDPSPKAKALKAAGAFNPRADHVHHPLFDHSEFFDPQDLPQLKYEALRALQADDYSITRAATEFGLSRPTLYQAQEQFKKEGLEGLLARKRGPKSPHKLIPEVRQYLQELTASEPGLGARELSGRLRQKFKLKVHPRTVEKALKTGQKRGRQTPP